MHVMARPALSPASLRITPTSKMSARQCSACRPVAPVQIGPRLPRADSYWRRAVPGDLETIAANKLLPAHPAAGYRGTAPQGRPAAAGRGGHRHHPWGPLPQSRIPVSGGRRQRSSWRRMAPDTFRRRSAGVTMPTRGSSTWRPSSTATLGVARHPALCLRGLGREHLCRRGWRLRAAAPRSWRHHAPARWRWRPLGYTVREEVRAEALYAADLFTGTA